MDEGKCVNVCPDKKTVLNGRCEKCTQSECRSCMPENPEKCLKCSSTSPRFKYNCENKCPIGTFLNLNECIKCDNKCLECSDEKTCLKCASQFILDNGSCVNVCPDGKVANEGQCNNCVDRCKTCTEDGTRCLKCFPPYKTHNYFCKDKCPDGYYDDPVNNECKECKIGCLNCNNENTCLQCRPGFFIKKGECVTNCGTGLYGDCKEHTCKNCNTLCDECVEATSQDCVRCAPNAFRSLDSCVNPEDCRPGTFPNKSNRECQVCNISFCEQCSDQNTCTVCVKGKRIDRGKCVNGNTFTSLFSNPTFVSTSTYNDLTTPMSKLNYIAVNVPHVSISFWLRLLTPVQKDADGLIFTIKNSPGFDYSLKIDSKINKCKFTVNFRENNNLSEIIGMDCSYERLFDWKFFSINLAKESGNSISIKLFRGSVEEDVVAILTVILRFSKFLISIFMTIF
jgi:hypothetical protein